MGRDAQHDTVMPMPRVPAVTQNGLACVLVHVGAHTEDEMPSRGHAWTTHYDGGPAVRVRSRRNGRFSFPPGAQGVSCLLSNWLARRAVNAVRKAWGFESLRTHFRVVAQR